MSEPGFTKYLAEGLQELEKQKRKKINSAYKAEGKWETVKELSWMGPLSENKNAKPSLTGDIVRALDAKLSAELILAKMQRREKGQEELSRWIDRLQERGEWTLAVEKKIQDIYRNEDLLVLPTRELRELKDRLFLLETKEREARVKAEEAKRLRMRDVMEAAKNLKQPGRFGIGMEISQELREDNIYKLTQQLTEELNGETKRALEGRAGIAVMPQPFRPKPSPIPPSPKKKPSAPPISEIRVIILED